MIKKQTRLRIVDNSGAKVIKVFHLFGYFSTRSYGKIGDLVLGSVVRFRVNKKVEKKQLCKVLILTTKKGLYRKNGTFIKFDENFGVVVSDAKKMLGTRIFSPLPKELKSGCYPRLASMVKKVV
jgi:large subunit ribosomal protein L14